MTAARILVVIGTSMADTFNHALAHRYVESARSGGAEVRVIDLAHDPVPAFLATRAEARLPREGDAPLDDAVARYVEDVRWASHLTVFYPQWWGAAPAAFKAWIDGVLLAGFAHQYRGKQGWDKLLAGRTGRIVTTMDSPSWWNLAWYWLAADVAVHRATLWYCGVKTVGIDRLAAVRVSTADKRERWLERAASRGAADAKRQPAAALADARPEATTA